MKMIHNSSLPRRARTAFSLLFLIATNLLFCAAVGYAQSTVPTWAQSYGVGSYDQNGQPTASYYYGSGVDSPVGIAPMPDGGVVVAGQLGLYELQPHTSSDRESSAGLVRYDRNGAILWQTLLRLPDYTDAAGFHINHSAIRRVRTDAAGNIFICGFLENSSPTTSGRPPFVAKFDSDGHLIWRNGIKSLNYSFSDPPSTFPEEPDAFTSLDLLSDGGVIVGSSVRVDYAYGANNRSVPFLVKFNNDGSLAFHREYNTAYQYAGLISACARPGGVGYALLLPPAPNGTAAVAVILTDAVGNPISQRSFTGSNYGGSPQFITTSADGGFLFLSGLTVNNGGGSQVHKLNADLTPIWQKDLHNFSATDTLTPTADGGCIVNGYRTGPSNSSSEKALLLTLDGNGILRSAHELGGALGEGPSVSVNGSYLTSCPTTDGALAFTISTASYRTGLSKSDWWVVKSNAGRVPGFADTMFDPPLTDFAEDDSNGAASFVSSEFGPGPDNESGITTGGPGLILENLANETGIDQLSVKFQAFAPVFAPAHGGLSPTNFTVNESDTSSNNLNDSVLRFHAAQTGTPAKLLVNVQANAGAGWVGLPDGLDGRMAYAPQVTGYVLHSTNYPMANGVRFRAVSSAPGYPDSISNEVGPFNLQQNQPHLGPTLLFVTTNGEINAIRFGVKETTIPAGIFVRMQSTQTPTLEDSWSDVSINNTALMQQDPADLNQFYLGTDEYPEGEGIYFRAVASNSNGGGYVKSISIPYGPFKFLSDPAATVTISVNGANTTPNDIDGGYLLPPGGFTMKATATSGRFLKRITLLYDGNVVKFAIDGANNVELANFRTNIPGDHIVEAYATDDLGVTGAAAPIHVRILPAAPGKAFMMTSSGNWNSSANWIDIQGNHGVPGANDFAILSTFSPTLTTDVTVNAMSMNGGTLDGTKTLTVTAFCTIADGTIKSNLTIPSGSTCELLNDSDIALSGTLNYSGILRLHGKGGIGGIYNTGSQASAKGPDPEFSFGDVFGAIKGFGQAIVDLVSGGRRGSKAAPAPPHPIAVPEVKHIASKIAIPTGKVTVIPAPSFAAIVSHDGGGIVSHDGGGIVSHDGGGLVAAGAGNLVAAGAGNLVAAGAGNLISQDGAGLIAAGAGNLIATGGGNLVAAGAGNLIAAGAGNRPTSRQSDADAPSASAGISLGGGEIDLSGLMIFGDVTMDGGILSGSGVIVGSLTNNSGFISPGHSAGVLAVTGSFTQGPNGTLIVENGGATPDKFDQLLVGGSAALGGKLDVKLINGYAPDPADTFAPLGYGSVSGTFASVSGNAQVTMDDTGLLSSLNPALASPAYGQPANISTRMKVLTDDHVLIGGFIVSGPSGSTKKVLIRGVGPSLSNYGLTGVLSDPLLEFHKPDGSTITNDNWGDAPNKDQIPNGFAPSNPKESVVLADLAPGAYTVIEKGAHGETGIGLTEIYDIDGSNTVALANISTRGFVDTGDNVMIGGFIVSGNEPAQILVRATGPTLKNYGLTGVLEDPTLDLTDANGNVISNDDWRAEQEAAINASTVAPSNDKEPAILGTFVPGGYTAIVRGKDNTTGIAIVEAYKIK